MSTRAHLAATPEPRARTCPTCGARSADALLCRDCTRTTKRALRQIAEWWPELEQTITRQARLHPNANGGAVFRPLPFDADASRLGDAIHADLVGWVRLGLEVGLPHPERGDTPHIARHLAANVDLLQRLGSASELPQVDQWPARIRRAVDYPDERGKIKVGPCPEVHEDGPCSGVVWARFYESESPTMTCEPPQVGVESCGVSWPAGQWEKPATRILARMAEQQRARDLAAGYAPKVAPAPVVAPMPLAAIIPLVSVADAALIYATSERTVWRWLSDGKLWPFGSRDARMVSAWQVADLAGRNRRHPTLLGPEGPADPVMSRTLNGTTGDTPGAGSA